MIGALLDAIASDLGDMTGAGELLEGVTTVKAGDEQPNETAEHPLVTVDVVRDQLSLSDFQTTGLIRGQVELKLSLYVCDVRKSATPGPSPARQAWDLWWRLDGSTLKGLKAAIMDLGGVAIGRGKLIFSLGDAQPKRKASDSKGRWTYALEAPLTARAAVGR